MVLCLVMLPVLLTSRNHGMELIFYKGDTTMFQDKVLVCKDCGQEFTFTAGEQAFYAEKGFQNEPAHCRHCRAIRKRQPRERVQHQTVCSSCGKTATIPFVPKNDAPVYCDACFKARRS